MQADSHDARVLVAAIEELRDAVLFHAALTTNPQAFALVDAVSQSAGVRADDPSAIAHGIKSQFEAFRARRIR